MKKFTPVLLLIIMLFILVSCGSGGSNGGKMFEGRWEANVRRGYSSQNIIYDIKHTGGNEYVISVEVDGVKQAETLQAVYLKDKNSFRVGPDQDEAVPDGTERFIVNAMDFRKLK